MSQIDWSKAPEGATHFDTADYRTKSFMKLESGDWYFWSKINDGWRFWRPDGVDADTDPFVPRPTTTGWNGEGLPPVGTVCEFQGDNAKCPFDPWHADLHDGIECTVIAHFKSKALDLVAFTFVKPDGNTEVEQSLPGALRPLRTPEQIAAEDREKEIDAMFQIACKPEGVSLKKAIGLIYDAGYRKFEIVNGE